MRGNFEHDQVFDPSNLPANFAGKFTVPADPTGCAPWVGAIQSRGYGSVSVGEGKTALAHRVAYEHVRGPIPDGMTIDHLCRNKRCINPHHLEVVTLAENIHRAVVVKLAEPEYPCGHPRTPENTQTKRRANGWVNRTCRECRRIADRVRRHRAIA